jgi:hypothetical protein
MTSLLVRLRNRAVFFSYQPRLAGSDAQHDNANSCGMTTRGLSRHVSNATDMSIGPVAV